MRPADRAWIALGVGVLAYDLTAPPGETLSEGADRYMVRHKWLVRAVGVGLVAHVCNFISGRYDPVHWVFVGLRKLVTIVPKPVPF